MDVTDLAILRQLAHPVTFQWDVRVSYAEVGRAIGIDEETVRARVKRMQEAGVIRGWEITVNPRAFGREASNLQLAFPDLAAKERAMPALLAFDGVRFVFDHLGPSVGLVLFHEPGAAAERQVQVLSALAGKPAQRFPVSMPPIGVALERADWRLLRALRKDPRRSFADLAEELGQAEKTVRRRLTRLTDGKVLFIMPRVDLGKMDGIVSASFVVAHKDPKDRGEADAFLRSLPGLMFAWYEGPVSRISVARRNVAEVEALRKELLRLPGVASVHMEIASARHTVDAWLDDLVERFAEGATPPPAAPAAAPPRATRTTRRSPARPPRRTRR